MPVQSKEQRAHTQHPTVTGAKERAAPSLNAAWDYFAEEDKRAIEEIVKRYSHLAKE